MNNQPAQLIFNIVFFFSTIFKGNFDSDQIFTRHYVS